MEARQTMMETPVDVTVATWVATCPSALEEDDRSVRRAYNLWAHERLQSHQRDIRAVPSTSFMALVNETRSRS